MADDTDPTEDMVRREIKAAMDIFKSDHIHASLAEIKQLFSGGKPSGDDNPTEGNPPPSGDPKPSNADKKTKKGIWWGNYQS